MSWCAVPALRPLDSYDGVPGKLAQRLAGWESGPRWARRSSSAAMSGGR